MLKSVSNSDDSVDREQFMVEVPDIIPECVAGIRAIIWKDRRHASRGIAKPTAKQPPARQMTFDVQAHFPASADCRSR